MNPGPGLTEAFANVDDEIQPVMIEVWDGKRIAWAIAILSALILIPVTYLLYDSYLGSDKTGLELQRIAEPNTTSTELVASSENLKPELENSPGIVITDPAQDSVVNFEQPVVVPDNQINNVANPKQQLETSAVSANTKNQYKEIKSTASGQHASTVTTASTADIAKPTMSQTTAVTDKVRPVAIVLADTESIPETAPVESSQESLPKVEFTDKNIFLKSRHVSRARLVTAMNKREPVGNSVDKIKVSEGNDIVRVYYFTEVNGLAGKTITYRWLHNGNLIFSKNVNVKGNYTWRSYIGKIIPETMTGSWVVEVIDSENNLLVKKGFEAV